MKKVLSMVLTCSLLISIFSTNVFANNAKSNNREDVSDQSSLVSVTLYTDEDQIIVAEVPRASATEYTEHIQTDSKFRSDEIAKVSRIMNGQETRALPPGRILSQNYLYKSDIKKWVDRGSGAGTFARLISNPINDIIIEKIVKAAKFSNIYSLSAAILSWMAGDLLSRQESWWKDSYMMIIDGKIRCVRATFIKNTVSEYPKAYRILERL